MRQSFKIFWGAAATKLKPYFQYKFTKPHYPVFID